MPGEAHECSCKATIERTGSKRRDAGDLNRAIEGLVVMPKPLIVRAIPRLVDIEERDHQSWSLVVATHSAGGLYILGVRFRLPDHDHQTEARDVEAYGDHVRRYRAVDPLLDFVEWALRAGGVPRPPCLWKRAR